MLFPGGIEGTANATLILSVAAAVIYGIIVNTRPTLARSVVKTLAVGAAGRAGRRRKRPVAAVRRAGAECRRRCLPVARGRPRLPRRPRELPRGASRSTSRCSCIAGGGAGLVLAETWRVAVAVVIGVSALVMVVLLWRRVKPAMRLPILVYVAGNCRHGPCRADHRQPFHHRRRDPVHGVRQPARRRAVPGLRPSRPIAAAMRVLRSGRSTTPRSC